jgi:periplasmic divalent cation tolerance protein
VDHPSVIEDPYLLVFITVPTAALAEQVSRALVARRLVACAHILPAGLSIYSWNGVIESTVEQQVIFKTRQSRYAALESAVAEMHPYGVPEIVSVPVLQGLPSYLDWVSSATDATATESS